MTASLTSKVRNDTLMCKTKVQAYARAQNAATVQSFLIFTVVLFAVEIELFMVFLPFLKKGKYS